MAFIKLSDWPGKVFAPELKTEIKPKIKSETKPAAETPKKNPCPDCFSCQMCSNTRCQVCTHQIAGTGSPHGSTAKPTPFRGTGRASKS